MNAFATGLIIGIFVTITGCSSSGGTGLADSSTHKWVAKNKIDEVNFERNNKACANTGQGISAYESCMAAEGYYLYDD